jgi:DNA gyrase/topoisomerase IV subunit A
MSHHKEWDDEEVKTKYRDMYYKLLSFDNESYNPLKLNIIQPEQYFDIQFQEDWARYEYIIGKEKFEGFLSVKGTMDLVFDNSGYLSGMDYKTGKSRVNWATGKTKYLDDFKEDKQLLTLMENGYGKRTPVSEYALQGRGGMGIKTAQVTAKTGKLVTGRLMSNKDPRDLLIFSLGGQVIRTSSTSVSVLGRATQGVRVMRFKNADDKVATATMVGGGEEDGGE